MNGGLAGSRKPVWMDTEDTEDMESAENDGM